MKSLKIFLLASLAGASFAVFADTTTTESAQDLNPNAQNTTQIMTPATTNATTQNTVSTGPTMKDCEAMETKCHATATAGSEGLKKQEACLARAEKCKDQATGITTEPKQPAASQPAVTTKPAAY